jgi:hypothetical protein
VSEGHITVVPEVLVTGGGGALDGLAATLMRTLGTGNGGRKAIDKIEPTAEPPSADPPAAEPEADPIA